MIPRSRSTRAALVALLPLAAYLTLWPVPIQPVAWSPPRAPRLEGPYAPNERLKGVTWIAEGKLLAEPPRLGRRRGRRGSSHVPPAGKNDQGEGGRESGRAETDTVVRGHRKDLLDLAVGGRRSPSSAGEPSGTVRAYDGGRGIVS